MARVQGLRVYQLMRDTVNGLRELKADRDAIG
jgi:hypothetical protein